MMNKRSIIASISKKKTNRIDTECGQMLDNGVLNLFRTEKLAENDCSRSVPNLAQEENKHSYPAIMLC